MGQFDHNGDQVCTQRDKVTYVPEEDARAYLVVVKPELSEVKLDEENGQDQEDDLGNVDDSLLFECYGFFSLGE